MANSYTTNLNLTKPELGADNDAWGGHLNADLDTLDAIFKPDGTGSSVGLNIGAGKTLSVAGTLAVSGVFNITGTIGGTAFASYVTLTGTQTLTNKTLTSPTIATILNVGTLTLPLQTDTLVGRATTDTLTNKTLTSPSIASASFTGATTFAGALAFPSSSIDGSGNGAFATVSDSIGNLRNVPQNAQSTSYTLVASDNGKHISITTGGVAVPSGVFSVGQSVTIYNNSAFAQTITQGSSVTMYQVGTANTGNRTLAQRGLCTVFCVASNTFVITGGGLT